MVKNLAKAMVMKAFDVFTTMFIIKSHTDLELSVSRWSRKKHTFMTSLGEFTSALEDVSVMFHLSVFADESATSLVLSMVEEKKV